MAHRRSFAVAASLMSLGFCTAQLPAAAVAASPPAIEGDGALGVDFADPLESLIPDVPRDEAAGDRLHALALYATGRTLEQQEDYAGALRRYQRALRYYPRASVARDIVALAFSLERPAEAIRYAVKAAELDAGDAELLKRLGRYLVEEGDYERGLAMYEKARALRVDSKSPDTVAIAVEIARLYASQDRPEKSIPHVRFAREALEKPDEFGHTARQHETLLADGDTYALLGDIMLDAGRLDEAGELFELAHRIKADKALLSLRTARLHRARGRLEDALTELTHFLESDQAGRSYSAYELLEEVLKALNRQDEHLAILEGLGDRQPNNALLQFAVAESYRRNGLHAKAREAYSKLLLARPSIDVYLGLVQVDRELNDAPALLRVLASFIEQGGDLASLGDAGEQLVSQPEWVDKLLQEAGRVDPEDEAFAALQRAAGTLAATTDRWDSAEQFYERALQSKPSNPSELWLDWGVGLLLADEHQRAIKVFRRAIEDRRARGLHPAFYFYLASALAMDDQNESALAAAAKAVELRPDDPRFASRTAWILHHAERHDEAAAAYQQVIDRFEGDARSEVRDVLRECRFALSSIAVAQRRFEDAEQWLEQVLDEFPDDAGAKNDLGYVWADRGRHLQKALRMTQDAVAAEPENAAYLDSLGWALFRTGQVERAVAPLEKAAKLASDGVIFDHLGDVYEQLGRREDALAAWRKAAAAFETADDHDHLAAVRKKLAKPPDPSDGRPPAGPH